MLRKIGVWSVLSAVMLAVMAGCSPVAQDAQPNTVELSCDIRATYRDLVLAGTLERHSVGTLELSFTEPETLDGLTAVWDGEDVTLEMYGLSFTADPETVPESAFGEEVIAVLDAVLSEDSYREFSGDNTLTLTGETRSGSYTLVYDGATGYPLSLTMPELPLSVEFIYND